MRDIATYGKGMLEEIYCGIRQKFFWQASIYVNKNYDNSRTKGVKLEWLGLDSVSDNLICCRLDKYIICQNPCLIMLSTRVIEMATKIRTV